MNLVSLIRNGSILVIIFVLFLLIRAIYKKTRGGSIAYEYLYKSTIIILVAFIFFFSIDFYFLLFGFKDKFFAFVDFLIYGLVAIGFLYLVIGLNDLGVDLHMSKISQEFIDSLKKYGIISIVIVSIVASQISFWYGHHEFIRASFSLVFCLIWFTSLYLYYPFFKAVKNTNISWKFVLIAMCCALISSVFDIFLVVHESFELIAITFYGFMGLFFVLGFYKLGKMLQAF